MRPLADSRGVRVSVARGIMAYSEVIQPLPLLRRNCGTVSSTDAVQITRVLPISMSTEPSAVEMKSGTMFTGRIWSGARLSERKTIGGDSTLSGFEDLGSRIRPERSEGALSPQTILQIMYRRLHAIHSQPTVLRIFLPSAGIFRPSR